MSRLLRTYGVSTLRHPVVVDDFSIPVVKVKLVDEPTVYSNANRRFRNSSHLSPPVVIGGGIVFAPIQDVLTSLAPAPRRAKSVLRPPVVVGDFIFSIPVVKVKLVDEPTVYSNANRRFRNSSHLSPPVVIGPSIAFYGPRRRYVGTSRVDQRLRRARSTLSPPTVVGSGVVNVVYPPVALYLAASKQGTPKSVLRPPVVVDPVLAPPVATSLAYSLRGTPKPHLQPPAVIDLKPQAYYLSTTLVRIGVPRTITGLFPPAVITPIATNTFAGPSAALVQPFRGTPKSVLGKPADLVDEQDLGFVKTNLAYSLRGKPIYLLQPPAVVAPVLARPIDTTFAPQELGAPKSRLAPPAVVAPVLAPPVRVTRQKIRPARTIWRLTPPAVVTAEAPSDAVADITLTYSLRGTPKSRLAPPTATFAFRIPIVVTHLAYSLRGKPKSLLGKPTDLVDSQDVGSLRTHLAYSKRGAPKSRLYQPTVIFPFFARTTVTSLAYSLRGKAKPLLGKPVVIDLTPQVFYLSTTFVQITPPPTQAKLETPTAVIPADYPVDLAEETQFARITPPPVHSILRKPVVVAQVLAIPTATALAYSLRGQPKPRLSRPVVVGAFSIPVIRVQLARIKPQSVHSVLRKPADLVDEQDLGFVKTNLAYSLRGAPKSALKPPTVVAPVLAKSIETTFAPQKSGIPKSKLFRPTAVFPFFARPTDVTLARIRPVRTLALLGKPTDTVGTEDQGAVAVTLTYSLRGKPKSSLTPPTVIDLRPQTRFLSTWLAYSRRGAPKSTLNPPPDIQVVPQSGPGFAWLTYSSRGKPKSVLRKPVVIDLRPQTRFLSVTLALSRRPQTKSRLLPVPAAFRPVGQIRVDLARIRPARVRSRFTGVVYPGRVFEPLTVALAPSFRGTPKSILNPPTDLVDNQDLGHINVNLVRIRPVGTQAGIKPPTVIDLRPQVNYLVSSLANSRRGVPKSLLGKPTDLVDARDQGTLAITLAASSRGTPTSFLKAPTVVGRKQTTPLDVTLAPQTRGTTISFLKAPTVVRAQFAARPFVAHLVRIRPVAVSSLLKPPTVVNAPVPFTTPLSLTLVRIRPRKTLWKLGGIAATASHAGTIYCGDDSIYAAYSGDSVEAGAAYGGDEVAQGVAFGGVTTEGNGIVCGGDTSEGNVYSGDGKDG